MVNPQELREPPSSAPSKASSWIMSASSSSGALPSPGLLSEGCTVNNGWAKAELQSSAIIRAAAAPPGILEVNSGCLELSSPAAK